MQDRSERGTPRRGRWPWLAAVLVGAVGLTLALAACSGASPGGVASLNDSATTTTASGGGGGQSKEQGQLAWARCMRQHGADVPDPQISGGSIVQPLPDREQQAGPEFQAAQQACRQYLPNGGQPDPPSAEERQRAVALARCMRAHGINVPDPQFTADAIIQEGPTGVDRNDPRLKAAEQACAQYGQLPPPKP